MYSIIKFFENVLKYFKIKSKVLFWKIKYGKRIKLGKHITFRRGMLININKSGYLQIGNDTHFNNYCSINCHSKIIIGSDNIFGENVKIYDHNHVFNNKNVDIKKSFNTGEIEIGNENWIGSNVVILSKCKLQNRNVVGASVVLNRKFQSEKLINNRDVIDEQTIVFKE